VKASVLGATFSTNSVGLVCRLVSTLQSQFTESFLILIANFE